MLKGNNATTPPGKGPPAGPESTEKPIEFAANETLC